MNEILNIVMPYLVQIYNILFALLTIITLVLIDIKLIKDIWGHKKD